MPKKTNFDITGTPETNAVDQKTDVPLVWACLAPTALAFPLSPVPSVLVRASASLGSPLADDQRVTYTAVALLRPTAIRVPVNACARRRRRAQVCCAQGWTRVPQVRGPRSASAPVCEPEGPQDLTPRL
jgi:hypothetical protein